MGQVEEKRNSVENPCVSYDSGEGQLLRRVRYEAVDGLLVLDIGIKAHVIDPRPT